MNAVATDKSSGLNRLEGLALTALFQGFPTFAATAAILKFINGVDIVARLGGAVIFVVVASIFHALMMPFIARKFPRFAKNSYEPLFFDASLPVMEKILRWRTQPTASLQLLTTVMILSVLAVAVVSLG